ncbi:hypothetical protein Poli38472_013830 [Pythium oligandrum]|uniref:Chromodomain-helicase-DNA-binding protein 1-like n=1 Tax=Pythium oligandrum TaxID=41045 RepID=A0A8K1C270_PYTOL|nr:hypothetical protein Poli38472_013830 [Pythium oligandrum]|eukprot:TMW55068.1 hypothetical protein Poli38472_013830 [Pythium oligandrum]
MEVMQGVVKVLKAYEQRNAIVVARCQQADAPKALKDVTLHDYQLEGLRWLLTKYAQGLNPILGDEMGLGKTLQTISFITSLLETDGVADGKKRFLIVAPLSVVPNWVEQFGRFAPGIAVHAVAGDKAERIASKETITEFDRTKPLVTVTTYETLLSETEFFNSIQWTLMVLDEGHRLKNPEGRLHQLLKTTLVVERKVILSGTPVQNDLRELYALLSLLNPAIFKDAKAFETAFEQYFSAKAQELPSQKAKARSASPQVAMAEKLMRDLLSPLLLLRTVQDVNSSFSLPPMSEIVVHTPMSPMQREYYKEIVARNSNVINSVAVNQGARISLLNILPHLRKACNHPYLFPGAEPEPFCEGSHLYVNSGKLFVLHQLLPRLRADGHCVLLFSQSTQFLDILQDYLTYEGFAYERVDGSIRGKERWQAIERFRSSPDTFVFLMSTRAGGVGLNLQRADTVIMVDSDFNPQADLQAVARAYRLGQTKPIHVIKLVTAHTVEEIIYRRALKKMRMADKIRNCARDSEAADEVADDGSKESLLEMIQFGLHKLLADEEEQALLKPLEDAYIERILARKTMTIEGSTAEGDSLDDAAGDFQEENMYYFDGEDYSASDVKLRDSEILQRLCAGGQVISRGVSTRRKRYAGEEDVGDDSGDESIDLEQQALDLAEKERRRQQREQKKLVKWHKNNYTSMVIESTEGVEEGLTVDLDRALGIHFVSGDASQPPLIMGETSPMIIVHCVDTSGVWSTRGFFRSLSTLSPTIQQQYEASCRNDDLKLGQAHLIQLPSQENRDIYVCLLVVQGFATAKGKKRRVGAQGQVVRNGKSSTFRLHALERALHALALRALALDASVHMPRIGYGTPQFNWYAVERLIKRHLCERGVDTSVYYYSPNRRP